MLLLNFDAFSFFGCLAAVVLYVLVQLDARDKDGHRLTQVWRRYALQHGDSIWAPSRFNFLLPWASDVHAKLEGVRHGVPFTVEITAYDQTHGGDKDTSFRATQTWLPEESSIAITRDAPPSSWTGSTHEPALRRHQVDVYVSPPELASIFEDAQADAVLRAFSKLPFNLYLTGWRSEAHFKRYGDPSIMMVSLADWCDDPDQLDAIIEVLTRLCALQPTAAPQASLRQSSFGSPHRR